MQKGFTQTVNHQLTTRKTSEPESVAAAHSRIREHREPEVDPALHPIKQATENRSNVCLDQGTQSRGQTDHGVKR